MTPESGYIHINIHILSLLVRSEIQRNERKIKNELKISSKWANVSSDKKNIEDRMCVLSKIADTNKIPNLNDKKKSSELVSQIT